MSPSWEAEFADYIGDLAETRVGSGQGNAKYDAASAVYVPSDTARLGLRARLANARASAVGLLPPDPLVVLHRGDSTTFGLISGDNPLSVTPGRLTSYVDHVWRRLAASRELGGNVGESIMSVPDSRIASGNGWSGLTGTAGGSGTLTFVDNNVSDAYDLVLLRGGSAASVVVNVNGTPTTLSLTGVTNNTSGVFRVTAASLAAGHTVTVACPNVGTVQVMRIDPVNTQDPIIVRFGRFGQSGQLMQAMQPSTTFQQIKPDVVHILAGVNDVPSRTDAQFYGDLSQFVTTWQGLGVDVTIGVFPNSSQDQTKVAAFHQRAYQVADEKDCVLFDVSKRWAASLPLMAGDGTHFTLAGVQDVARMHADFWASL